MSAPAGAVITVAAAELLTRLQDRHGPVMFHQSGGCCDGSSPMCYPLGDFLVGDRDVLLGLLDVGQTQRACRCGSGSLGLEHTQLVIDVVEPGWWVQPEAPEGVHFLSRGRVFTDAEKALIEAVPVITGNAYERGERPSNRGQVVAGNAPGTCPSPR